MMGITTSHTSIKIPLFLTSSSFSIRSTITIANWRYLNVNRLFLVDRTKKKEYHKNHEHIIFANWLQNIIRDKAFNCAPSSQFNRKYENWIAIGSLHDEWNSNFHRYSNLLKISFDIISKSSWHINPSTRVYTVSKWKHSVCCYIGRNMCSLPMCHNKS